MHGRHNENRWVNMLTVLAAFSCFDVIGSVGMMRVDH